MYELEDVAVLRTSAFLDEVRFRPALALTRRGCRANCGDAGLTGARGRGEKGAYRFLRTVFGWQRRRAAQRGLVGARTGSVTAIQRFGGSANLNLHFHALLFDGAYTRACPTARPVFHNCL
jgi:hypothetical protein